MDVIKSQQISSKPIEKVIVHPLVLLSIVDNYNRVAKDTRRRVVGVLLGSTFKGTVDVTNSYAGPKSLFYIYMFTSSIFLILCLDLMKVVDFRVSKLWILGSLMHYVMWLEIWAWHYVILLIIWFCENFDFRVFFSELLYESDLLERVAIVRGLNFAICIQL